VLTHLVRATALLIVTSSVELKAATDRVALLTMVHPTLSLRDGRTVCSTFCDPKCFFMK